MKQNGRPVNTISGQVYQIIRDEICSGVYAPGYWLQENELAARLSVSRSPVREALRRLAADHLVVEIPNKGIFVRAFTLRDIHEIFDVRVMLESYAIEHIYENLTDISRDGLADTLVHLKEAYTANDLETYIEYDTQLHNMIIRYAGNTLVEAINDQVSYLIQRFRSYSLKDRDRFDLSVVEHEQIVGFILDGRIEEAQYINCRHLERARDKIVDYINSLSNAGYPPVFTEETGEAAKT